MNWIKMKTMVCLTLILGLVSCSVYKYVPEGERLLNKVEVTSADRVVSDVTKYRNLSHQTPNSR